MPSPYTPRLIELEFDTKHWLLETVPRGMGVTAMLRDNAIDLPVDTVRHLLDTHPDPIEKQLEEARAHYNELLEYSDKDWEDLAKEKYEEEMAEYQKALAKFQEVKKGLEASLALIEKLKEQIVFYTGSKEFITNTLNFASSQIGLSIVYDHSSKPSTPLRDDPGAYKAKSIHKAHRDVRYYEETLSDAKRTRDVQLKEYDTYLDFITENLR